MPNLLNFARWERCKTQSLTETLRGSSAFSVVEKDQTLKWKPADCFVKKVGRFNEMSTTNIDRSLGKCYGQYLVLILLRNGSPWLIKRRVLPETIPATNAPTDSKHCQALSCFLNINSVIFFHDLRS